jgi:hypothetical protein
MRPRYEDPTSGLHEEQSRKCGVARSHSENSRTHTENRAQLQREGVLPSHRLRLGLFLKAFASLLLKSKTNSHQNSHQRNGLSRWRGHFTHKSFIILVPGGGVEPPREVVSADFESAASASSAIPAKGGVRRQYRIGACAASPFWRRNSPRFRAARSLFP